MNKKHRTKIKTLQPGFLYIIFDPAIHKPHDFMMESDEWEELQRRGFYGGHIFTKGIQIASLSDEDLEKIGLKRIESHPRIEKTAH